MFIFYMVNRVIRTSDVDSFVKEYKKHPDKRTEVVILRRVNKKITLHVRTVYQHPPKNLLQGEWVAFFLVDYNKPPMSTDIDRRQTLELKRRINARASNCMKLDNQSKSSLEVILRTI